MAIQNSSMVLLKCVADFFEILKFKHARIRNMSGTPMRQTRKKKTNKKRKAIVVPIDKAAEPPAKKKKKAHTHRICLNTADYPF